jgi:DNA-binding XRE family transcriptional regulator
MKKENALPKTDSTNSRTERQESTSLLSCDALWSRLETGPKARMTFVDSNLAKNLAFQIRSMRDCKNWNQEQLADRVQMNQNAISRLENPFYGKPTLTTLKRIAAVFDVALMVRFVPFGQLVHWVSGTPFLDKGLSPESMAVPSFADEKRCNVADAAKVTAQDKRSFPVKMLPGNAGILEFGASGSGLAQPAVKVAGGGEGQIISKRACK